MNPVEVVEVVSATCWVVFFGAVSVGEWINAGLLTAAIVTLFWTGLLHRRQAQSSDFGSYLRLTERYSDAWRKFRCATTPENRDYEFGEILNLIEGTCHLYKSGAIRGATREMIRNYLRDVLAQLLQNNYAQEKITQGTMNADTYSHIYQFAEKQGINIG